MDKVRFVIKVNDLYRIYQGFNQDILKKISLGEHYHLFNRLIDTHLVKRDNPDEDLVDDSLASDLDVNEMNLTDEADVSNDEIYGLFNTLRSKLSDDPGAASLIDQLESLFDASVMGER